MVLMLVVGVNGGGTKTEAICCNENGEITGRGLSGSSNKDNIGMEAAVENIKKTVLQATKKEPDIICIALAGLNTKKAFEDMHKRLSKEYKNLILEHDAYAELYLSTRGKPGIIAISGTGSVVLAYDGKKRYRRCDNGWFLGDEASGYYVGKEGLKVAAKMLLEDMPKTQIYYDIMAYFGFTNADDLLEWVYSYRNTVTTISSLSKVVYQCAENGDKHARAIVDSASSTLANAACELALNLGIKIVHTKGGMFKSNLFASNFENILKAKGIECKMLNQFEAEGALLIAADKAGVDVKLDWSHR